MKRESEHAICKDMQSLITIEKKYIFFFLDERMKCCSLGKHSTYSQESLHSLGTGKQFPHSQLPSVADIQRRTLSLYVWKPPRTPTFQAHERSRLNFSVQSDLWTVAAKKKKKKELFRYIFFFVLVRRLGCFNFRPRFYHCQGDLRQRLGQWAGNWWPWRMGRAILSTTEYK